MRENAYRSDIPATSGFRRDGDPKAMKLGRRQGQTMNYYFTSRNYVTD
jgi:hypothetical protein